MTINDSNDWNDHMRMLDYGFRHYPLSEIAHKGQPVQGYPLAVGRTLRYPFAEGEKERLRAKLEYTTIGFQLLPDEFTLSELQEVYEAILNRRLDKRNFRKKLLATGILEQTLETRKVGQHRPAALYRFNPRAEK